MSRIENREDDASGPPPAAVDWASQALDAMDAAVYVTDGDGRVVALNRWTAELLGRDAQDLLGAVAHDVFHTSPVPASDCPLLAPARSGEPAANDSDMFRRADGSLLPVSWRSAAMGSEDGPAGVVVVFADNSFRRSQDVADAAVREQVRSDLDQAETLVADLTWLGDLTQVMAGSLDERDAMLRMVRLVVPRLGDVSIGDVVDAGGAIERVGGAAAPGVDVDLDALLARPEVQGVDHRAGRTRATVTSGRVRLLSRVDSQDPAVLDPPSTALLAALDAEQVVIVPLVGRDHMLGVLGLIRRTGSPTYTPADLLLAADVGRRAGLVLDNARLYTAQADAAALLQRALLPSLPEIAGVRLAARYLPARDRFAVGGDWYDVFPCPGDDTTAVLVVGDVAGHDLAAATTMAALRNLVRGITVVAAAGPAEVLRHVDDSLDGLGVVGTATVALLTATATVDGHWRLRWSTAGHVPPIVVLPGRAPEMLDEVHDALLGTKAAPTRRDAERSVPSGTLLVLYTDGLVESRHEDLDLGFARLRQTLIAACGDPAVCADPARLSDVLLQRMPSSPDDDTAILVARLA